MSEEHIQYHKDGSLWARGPKVGGAPHGYWEWFRKNGTKLRSGHFIHGEQTGEWTTYDQQGKVYKVTAFRTPATKRAGATVARSRSGNAQK